MGKDYVDRKVLLEEFESSLLSGKKKLNKRTLYFYLSDLRKLLPQTTYRGYKELVDALKTNVEQMNEREDIKPSTKNRLIITGKILVRLLKTRGKIKEKIELPLYNRIERKPYATISPDDFEKIINVIPSDNYLYARDRTIYHFIYELGMRESEVANLKARDIEVEAGQTFVYAGSGNQRRKLEVDKATAEELNNYKKLYSKIAKQKKFLVLEEGNLFRNKHGEKISERSIHRNFKEWVEEAGVETTLLMLRHSYAKMHLDRRAGKKDLATSLGTTADSLYLMKKLLK